MRYLAIDKEFEIATKNYGVQKLPKNTLEVPQAESVEEVISFAGGNDNLVEQYNDYVYARAKNGATAVIRNAGEGSTIEKIIEKAVSYARSFNPATERKAGKKAILEGVEKLRELKASGELAQLSQADLLAMLEATLKV